MSSEFLDDDDLPSVEAAAPARERDPAGRYLPATSQPTPAAQEPETPEKPQHSGFMLAKAREYGVPDAESLTPGELDRLLTVLDRTRAQQSAAKPPVEEDEPVDWGKKTDGTPMTEAEFAKEYDPLWVALKKESHASKLEAGKAKKFAAELKAQWDRQEQEKNARQVQRQLHKLLAGRPDLFGAKPGEAEAGSAEAERYQIVVDRLNRLVQTQKHTSLEADAQAAMALFGPAPNAPKVAHLPKPKNGRPSIADYANGELATPTAKRGTEQLTRRQALIEQLAAAQRENGVRIPVSNEDDDDLPE